MGQKPNVFVLNGLIYGRGMTLPPNHECVGAILALPVVKSGAADRTAQRRIRDVVIKHAHDFLLPPHCDSSVACTDTTERLRRGHLNVPYQLSEGIEVSVRYGASCPGEPDRTIAVPGSSQSSFLARSSLLTHKSSRGEKFASEGQQTSVSPMDAYLEFVSVHFSHVGQFLAFESFQFQGRRSSIRLAGWPCVMRSSTSLR